MQKQLITIGPGGAISGLQFKKKGVNLQAMGKAHTSRITDIEWQEEKQMWAIRLLQGGMKGELLCIGSFAKATMARLPPSPKRGHITLSEQGPEDTPFLFSDYDDAVDLEVFTIQEATLEGRDYLLRNQPANLTA